MTRRNAAWGLLALCTACLVLAASSVSTEQCRDGGSCASARPSVDFVTPLEGDAGQLTGADSVKVLLKINDFEGSVGIYLDGKVTKWEKTAGGDLNTAVALGKSPSCGEWHMLEAVLMDAEGFRLENEEAEAAVRFHLPCDSGEAGSETSAKRANAFTSIYETYGWEPPEGTKETRSGPGSYLSRTVTSREFLGKIIKEYNIKSIFDAGCGDVNWQRHVPGIDQVEYHGVDIVPEMIEANKKTFADRPNMSFSVQDVVSKPLGKAYDLIICRDTLFHLPLFDAVQVLRNFDASGSKLLLSHFDEDMAHNWPDIEPGQWHVINLLTAPFKLPPPVASIPETGDEGTLKSATHYGTSRQLALWTLPALNRAPSSASSSLPPALLGMGVKHRCVVVGEHSAAPPSVAPFDVVICLGPTPHSYVKCDVRVTAADTTDGLVVVKVPEGEGRVEEREVLRAMEAAAGMQCASLLLMDDVVTDDERRPGGRIDQAAAKLWEGGVYVFGGSSEVLSASASAVSDSAARSSLLPVQIVNAFASPRFPPPESHPSSAAHPRVLCVIPARHGSQRLGGKLLRLLKGQTVLQRTYNRAIQAKSCSKLVVATEDVRIKEHVEGFGGKAVMTKAEWKVGTDRVFEAWKRMEEEEGAGSYQIIVNVQGDEPLLNPAHVDAAAELLLADPALRMSTLAAPIFLEEAQNQAVVKLVTDGWGTALYFSRALIPSTKPTNPPPPDKVFKRHIGIYGFRSTFLETYATLPFSDLSLPTPPLSRPLVLSPETLSRQRPRPEVYGMATWLQETLVRFLLTHCWCASHRQESEDLEQLKVLSAGFSLQVAMVDKAQPDVNTEEDLKVLEAMIA